MQTDLRQLLDKLDQFLYNIEAAASGSGLLPPATAVEALHLRLTIQRMQKELNNGSV